MAIDFLILFLLLLSLTINVLALGAFWVTPGLRTTANRFVINLLIVNIIGCLALAPTLFLRSNSYSYQTLDQTTIYKKLDHHYQHQQHYQHNSHHEFHPNINNNYEKFHHQIDYNNNNNNMMKKDIQISDLNQNKEKDENSHVWKIITSNNKNNDDFNRINNNNNNNKNIINTAEETMVRCMGKICEKITISSTSIADDDDADHGDDVDAELTDETKQTTTKSSHKYHKHSRKTGDNSSSSSSSSSSISTGSSGKNNIASGNSFSSYDETYADNLKAGDVKKQTYNNYNAVDDNSIELTEDQTNNNEMSKENKVKAEFADQKKEEDRKTILLSQIKNNKQENIEKYYHDMNIPIPASEDHLVDIDGNSFKREKLRIKTEKILKNVQNENSSQNRAALDNNNDEADNDKFDNFNLENDLNRNNEGKNLLHIQSDIRCWSLDLVAALSALSVLLIVGDTWCAVTDPLRYHSRISGLKAWLLIAVIWFFAILFGILSALRETTITSETVLKEKLINKTDSDGDQRASDIFTTASTYLDGKENDEFKYIQNSTYRSENGSAFEMIMFGPENLYNMIFSCVYFIVIILTPFTLVCCMYWRIFSEARENGLRMRQNGSSPLLQSALNLAHHNNTSHTKNHTYTKSNSHNHICINPLHSFNASTLHLNKDELRADEGLHMRIDNIDNSKKPLLILNNHESTGHSNRSSVSPEKPSQKDKNQNNILLTISKANDELKRNYSSRQLALLDLDEHELEINGNGIGGSNSIKKFSGVRQVHSTPNLHKYQKRNGSDSSLSDIDLNTNYTIGQNLIIHHPNRILFNRTHSITHCNHHNALQLPANIHQNASPKALSYMTSIRHRLSNASSLFKYREESRAARISILVVIMFLVSYLPYGILVLLQGRIFSLSNHATQLAVFVVLLGNITSPIIFAYRNKRVRRGVKRLFNLDPRAKDRQLQKHGILSSTLTSHKQQQQQQQQQQQHHHRHQSSIKGFFLRSSASHFHTNNSKNNYCKNINNNSCSTNNNNNNNDNSNNSSSNNIKKEKRSGAKPSINITTNKMSTYTLNTCKFLSPSAAANVAGSLFIDLEKCHYLKKKNVSLSTTTNGHFIKISKLKRNSNKPIVQEEEDINEDNIEELSDLTSNKIKLCNEINTAEIVSGNNILGLGSAVGSAGAGCGNYRVADDEVGEVLHDPVKIVISDNSIANNFINPIHSNNYCNSNSNSNSNNINEKRSILKIVCDSSRKLGCANGESCASSDCEIEPIDV